MEANLRRQIHEDRALILDYLNNVYPLSLPERELLDALLDLPRPIDTHKARRDVAYLQDRGLLSREKVAHPVTKKPEQRVKLTADGVTFCERGKPWGEIEDLDD